MLAKLCALITLLSLIGCAHKISPIRTSTENNAFAGEGFLRWGAQELRAHAEESTELSSLQASCHQGRAQNATDHRKSIERFSSILEAHQESPLYWNHVAVCHLYHEKLAQAQFAISLGMQKRGAQHEQALLHNTQGVIYLTHRFYPQALDSFKEAHRLQPHARTPRFNLAVTYIQFGHFAKAQLHLDYLYRSAPKDEEILSQMGIVLLLQGEHERAWAHFNKLSEPYRRRSDLSAVMAINALLLNEPEEARHLLLRQARAQDPFIRRMTQQTQTAIDRALEEKRERAPAQTQSQKRQ
jgi:predicted Zn-dependent protease